MSKMSMSEAGKLGFLASQKSRKEQKQKRIEAYKENSRGCFLCGKMFPYADKEKYRKKFCSRSCSAKYHNSFKSLKAKKNLPNCIECEKKLKKRSSKYCSSLCMQSYIWKLEKSKIEDRGKVEGIRQARRFLLEKTNRCQMCNNNTWLGKPILLICDHINGNSEDWSLDNLRMICSNCDATTPFYKNKNKGKGRAYRRERYKLGKSY